MNRHPILLANDHKSQSYRFRHVRDPANPDGEAPLGDFTLRAAGRQWIETPLGVRRGCLSCSVSWHEPPVGPRSEAA